MTYPRDPDRIDEFCSELAKEWKEKVPDWKFGQLICNLFRNLNRDPFFMEEDEMMDNIRRYLRGY
ncbi:MAG: hypothetical protein LUD40_16485 [Phocaeicola dorei]|nr:hypothetical protein [Phocaeicola dorei]